ncbi:hypothetical protein LS48_02785 [Aequorivita aquimaris]|uniref:Uncharacterized protein n=2 Tax=Aequorivita aquimaris TaxID=1548749 RepID=A0A137RFJ3_9FLAO|nr:hypothetical protein LS48_12680 [Aequorivita aquimaris]KXN99160.1 hypothetical protein LS48_08865 [Aequorivita aquimaris]KXO01394.1 hypothetical protein LS48_02785 [Aequorivita aquimaris]
MTKRGLESASADFGLIALAYNLKRMLKLGITLAGWPVLLLLWLQGALSLHKHALKTVSGDKGRSFNFYSIYLPKMELKTIFNN